MTWPTKTLAIRDSKKKKVLTESRKNVLLDIFNPL